MHPPSFLPSNARAVSKTIGPAFSEIQCAGGLSFLADREDRKYRCGLDDALSLSSSDRKKRDSYPGSVNGWKEFAAMMT